MADLAARRGVHVDADALARELGVPVVATVGVQAEGARRAARAARRPDAWQRARPVAAAPSCCTTEGRPRRRCSGILQRLGLDAAMPHTASDRIDRVVLHPVVGPAAAGAAAVPRLPGRVRLGRARRWPGSRPAPRRWATRSPARCRPGRLRSLLVDGVIAGAGGVLVFLPQIVILFFFILGSRRSGYLPRAAFLLDRLMGGVGLSGRSFIPLLSSFACAIPGIMAARTIANPRDRAGHHPDRAADDLLGAPAGLCAAHRRLRAAARGRPAARTAGAGAVRAVRRRHRRRRWRWPGCSSASPRRAPGAQPDDGTARPTTGRRRATSPSGCGSG